MKENPEGFLYPAVRKEACLSCGLCLRSCPVLNPDVHRQEPAGVWALREKERRSLLRSASGGAGDLAASCILREGGVVYGAAYGPDLTVRHVRIGSPAGKSRLQSSKYVQSDTGSTYRMAKKDLAEGRPVLYTGTPCQIAGLYAFLGREDPDLYTLDLICHGVPSPKFFRKYVEDLGAGMGGKVVSYNFRSKKKRGWGTNYLARTASRVRTGPLSLDKYGMHFQKSDCYRESCYQCPFASLRRAGDLTVGDFWAVAKSHPDFYSADGVSTVLVNTEKGARLFKRMEAGAFTRQISLEEGMYKQGNLRHPSGRPASRDSFYQKIDDPKFMDGIRVGLQPAERIKSLLPARLLTTIKRYL